MRAYLDALLTEIEAGRSPKVPEALRALAEQAAQAGGPADVEAWAARLAADIANATEEG